MRKSKYDQVVTTTPINEDNTNCSSLETQLERKHPIKYRY